MVEIMQKSKVCMPTGIGRSFGSGGRLLSEKANPSCYTGSRKQFVVAAWFPVAGDLCEGVCLAKDARGFWICIQST